MGSVLWDKLKEKFKVHKKLKDHPRTLLSELSMGLRGGNAKPKVQPEPPNQTSEDSSHNSILNTGLLCTKLMF